MIRKEYPGKDFEGVKFADVAHCVADDFEIIIKDESTIPIANDESQKYFRIGGKKFISTVPYHFVIIPEEEFVPGLR